MTARWIIAAGALAAAALPGRAQDPASLYVASVAASCAQCHGTAGRPAPGSVLPPLAGRPAAEIAAQMQAFKTGARPATVMHQIAKGYSDAQIAQLAAWFAAQK